jgi:hypothetical protein
MAGIEIDEDLLRDAVVDVAAGRGIGVNGLDVTRCTVGEGEIRLELETPFPWRRRPAVAFRRTEPARSYRLSVNGADAGSWRGEELEKGIPVPVPAAP